MLILALTVLLIRVKSINCHVVTIITIVTLLMIKVVVLDVNINNLSFLLMFLVVFLFTFLNLTFLSHLLLHLNHTDLLMQLHNLLQEV